MNRQLWAVFRAACAETWADRTAFWSRTMLMFANDVVWVIFFSILFHKAGTLRGWTFDQMAVLFAVTTAAVGVGVGLFANSRRIGKLISDGGLDSALTLPISPLGVLLLRKTEPVFIGDAIFGVTLFFVLGHPTPLRFLVFVGTAALGATILISFLVLISSSVFFLRGRHEHVELAFNSLTLFCTYPADLYGGLMKLVLFTALPAALISTVPAHLVNHFDLQTFAALVFVALAFAFLARKTFYVGLRRYQSGSLWTGA